MGGGANFEICLKEKLDQDSSFQQGSTKPPKVEAGPTGWQPCEHRGKPKVRTILWDRTHIPVSETTKRVSEHSGEERLTPEI